MVDLASVTFIAATRLYQIHLVVSLLLLSVFVIFSYFSDFLDPLSHNRE